MIKKTEILNRAKKEHDFIVKLRRRFHEYPELGMEEYETSEIISSFLRQLDIEHKKLVGQTGVVGLIRGQKPGKTIALRADMDALPMQDMKKVSYRSKNDGKMHACGHDAHMAIQLGAAKILNEMKGTFNGQVKLIFQPAEETAGGALPMIRQGVMKDPKVDAVFGLHVAPELPTGVIGTRYGQMNASSDTIKISVIGESTHGAAPQEGIDAIVVAAQIISALQTISSRRVDPREAVVISIGTIHGGTQGNIVAGRVDMVGTVRTLEPSVREKVMEEIAKVVKGICAAMGARGEIRREKGYDSLINHRNMVDLVNKTAAALFGKEAVVTIDHPSLGVEDFAYYLHEAPGAYFRLGCRNEKKGIIHGGHHNLFDIDEECLLFGVALQVAIVLESLESK